MKKFFSRLETLLKIRKAHVGRLSREVAYQKQKFNQWEEKKATLEQQISALMQEIRQKRKEESYDFQETYTQILDHLNLSLKNVKSILLAQKKQIEMQQQRLKRVIQERKLIEKIKEKHYTQWRVQSEQGEGILLDEITLNRSDSQ